MIWLSVKTPLGELWEGRAPRTACPEDVLLLFSTALILALAVTTSLIINENSEGFQLLTGWLLLVLTIVVIDFF